MADDKLWLVAIVAIVAVVALTTSSQPQNAILELPTEQIETVGENIAGEGYYGSSGNIRLGQTFRPPQLRNEPQDTLFRYSGIDTRQKILKFDRISYYGGQVEVTYQPQYRKIGKFDLINNGMAYEGTVEYDYSLNIPGAAVVDENDGGNDGGSKENEEEW